MSANGPLVGLRVLEFAGLGPAPFCGMLLADAGADVVRIDRQVETLDETLRAGNQVLGRGKRSVALDLKQAPDVERCRALMRRADVVLEGYRPGVMERLGLGPEQALRDNPRLVYGRMTGWGQTGPLASAPGHDLNYIALTGALHAIGSVDRPAIPLNLTGDFGGGALYLAFGVMAAVHLARATGKGQVVDCAMVDGATSLMSFVYGMYADGSWTTSRRANLLDGGAPFYDVYACADGKWIAIGPLEPQFLDRLLSLLSLDPALNGARTDTAAWPRLRDALERKFREHDRQTWCDRLEGREVCVAPVLSMAEAPLHAHNRARELFVKVDGVTQPAPVPRFSETPSRVRSGAPQRGHHNDEVLREWLAS